jgi:hypothetical protein
MSAHTEKSGPSYLKPWFRYQEMLLDLWKGLSAQRNRSGNDAKSIRPKRTSREMHERIIDQPAMTGHLYQYEKFLKYWNINPPSQHTSAVEADTGPAGHYACEGQSDSVAQPYDLWYEYYLSFVRGTDRYLAFWKSASDTFSSIQPTIPDETPSMITPSFKAYQDTWQMMTAWLMMPLSGLQHPEPPAFGHLFWMPGIARFWMDVLGATTTSTWISVLKKDIDNLIYETGRMREVINELKNQNLFSHSREGVMNEIVSLQRDAAARTMVLAGEMAALKTAVHELISALKKQNKTAHHPPKDKKGQPQPHT